MGPKFIFAKDIQEALKGGKREILVPEGSRISSAALDLIKEKGLHVTYVGSPKEGFEDSSPGTPSQEQPPAPPERKEEAIPPAPSTQSRGPVPEEMVEEIANRVIERFRALRGDSSAGRPQGEDKTAPESDDDLVICRCEEITKGEIKEAIRNGMKTLNGVKRVTRAGMGLCQGQTCERLVTQILARELGLEPVEIIPPTPRAPVRPVRLSVLAAG
jgi:bacterioferritin-associated ferredoxin